MAARKKKVSKVTPVVQIGRRRDTDVEMSLRVSKKTQRRLLDLADGNGQINLTEDDLVAAVQDYLKPKAEGIPIDISQLNIAMAREPEEVHSDTVLDAAKDIIYGDREQAYGSPRFNLDTIAQLWSVYLNRRFPFGANRLMELKAEDVSQMMILLKTARLIHNPTHRDSLVDQAGYAALQDRIQSL